jgi:hypothetical protein
VKLNDKHRQMIHLLILDRGIRKDSTSLIAKRMGVSLVTVRNWRGQSEFKEEFQKQLKLYRKNFDDVPLADRKERVKALDQIFLSLNDKQTALKVKVLQAIRQEVGDDKQILEVQHTGSIGIEAPPRAVSYEEWVQQNEVMESQKNEVMERVPVEAAVLIEGRELSADST